MTQCSKSKAGHKQDTQGHPLEQLERRGGEGRGESGFVWVYTEMCFLKPNSEASK